MDPTIRNRLILTLCLAGAALLGVSGKLWLIHNEGVDVPYMDQWNAEAQLVFMPAAGGELTFKHLAWPHNEHRVFWTRLLSLGLSKANGQWDARVGMVVNAFIHAAAIVLALGLMTRLASPACIWFGALAAVACITIPFAWENTLASFQSQFYLWLLLSIPATWLMLAGPPLGGRWWAGFGLGILCLGTMASGFFAFAAVAAVATLGILFDSRRTFRDFAAVAACAGMCVVGWLLVNHVPAHEVLRSQTVLRFLHACASQLAFPATDHPWLALLIQAPVAIWLFNRGRFGRTEESRGPITGLVVLALLAIASVAWSRGGWGLGRDSRYGDLLSLLFLINAVLLAMIVLKGIVRPSWRAAIASAWCVAALVGFSAQIDLALSGYLPALKTARAAESGHIAKFLREGDPSIIIHAPNGEITFPSRDQLATIIANPAIAGLMPASVRPAVRVESDTGQTRGFIEGTPAGLPDEGRVWSATTSGDALFVSMPLPPSPAGLLRFKVAGDLGTSAFPFQLRSLSTGLTSAPAVTAPAGQRWKTVNIIRPADPIVIEAGPSAGSAWGAFNEPVELGMLSWIAGKTAKNWWMFAATGAACLAAAAAIGLIPTKRRDTFSLREDGSVVLSSSD